MIKVNPLLSPEQQVQVLLMAVEHLLRERRAAVEAGK